MNKLKTIDLKGKEYATVATRLIEFRQQNPRASITTSPVVDTDAGTVLFTTTIKVDLANENSAESTGHSLQQLNGKGDKAFEKGETVSVGRALSLLGYTNNGQIAGTEEMDEFHAIQNERINAAVEALGTSKDIYELKSIFMNLGSLISHSAVIQAKDKRKEQLSEKS